MNTADLAEGYHFVRADNADETATCRGADIPFEAGSVPGDRRRILGFG